MSRTDRVLIAVAALCLIILVVRSLPYDGLVGLGSLAIGGGALIFAALAWRASMKELRLAEEEATLRPDLVVSVAEVGEDMREPGSAEPHEQRAITFRIENRGRSAAHGIHCDFHLPLERLTPVDMHGGTLT